MGFDCGFDTSPPLEQNNQDHADKWSRFITAVFTRYEGHKQSADADLLILHTVFIESNVGEHPLLPYDGTKFRRFSSKVSGGLTQEAEPVIRQVFRLAKERFGDRVSFWHELAEDEESPHGVRGMVYGWAEAYESFKTYRTEDGEALCEPSPGSLHLLRT